jgi:hypothetical protein
MADLYCRTEHLLVDDVGGHDIRLTLLSLEPGSRIWLSLDGDEIQFERLSDADDGGSRKEFLPVGGTEVLWRRRLVEPELSYVEELQIIERPRDRNEAGFGFYRKAEIE